uniref:(northern house mosquito) hypothetical protein n=1 Tax=Culex pipiens TaxID=7175 RepID=A0A8D8L449_CULPI
MCHDTTRWTRSTGLDHRTNRATRRPRVAIPATPTTTTETTTVPEVRASWTRTASTTGSTRVAIAMDRPRRALRATLASGGSRRRRAVGSTTRQEVAAGVRSWTCSITTHWSRRFRTLWWLRAWSDLGRSTRCR